MRRSFAAPATMATSGFLPSAVFRPMNVVMTGLWSLQLRAIWTSRARRWAFPR